jgi:hypothetical protein|tara:strand:- start:64019 stop:65071 length:1053 start_codon:yes stop_codon:yes gene_type:complete
MKQFPNVEKRVLCFLISALGFLFWGCSSSNNVFPDSPPDISDIDYSLVYIIHGDANYLYHQEGVQYNADKEALSNAIDIARNAASGEVFIFHQKPERKILWLFPKKDRRFYHFRNGKLVTEGNFSPKDGGFSKEIELYNSRSVKSNVRSMFFYFGHEIPTFSDQKYHSTEPGLAFDTQIFGDDLSRFNSQFDLTVLSTCNNANPYLINELKHTTDFVVASPQNLHLSYLSLDQLKLLEQDQQTETKELALAIAKDSFEKLSSYLQTMVTVGVYDLSQIKEYSGELASKYNLYLEDVFAKPRFTDNVDCSSIASLQPLLDSTGVHIFFKSAAFGRKSTLTKHSGWGCKEKE